MSWLTRTELPAYAGNDSGSPGLLVGAVPGEGFVAVSSDARSAIRSRSAATLKAAGIERGQCALVSLNSDGDLSGAFFAEALVEAGARAAVVGPRGRMRTLAAFRALRPQVWVTTPTGALDFLARLYLEFNVDPVELELDRIFVVGEIASAGTERRLAAEFEARVTNVYCDPVFGGAWAFASDGKWQVLAPEILGLGELARDVLQDGGSTGFGAELLLQPDWPGPLAGKSIRTGQVTGRDGMSELFVRTVGDHVLVRGRWLSLPLLRRGLAQIDGLAGYALEIDRGEGTLDKLVVRLAFDRPGLVENPMWAARAREAIAAVTPVDFSLERIHADESSTGEQILDRRGHHLGTDRVAVARSLAGEGDEPATGGHEGG